VGDFFDGTPSDEVLPKVLPIMDPLSVGDLGTGGMGSRRRSAERRRRW
jgi:hypothetical protein